MKRKVGREEVREGDVRREERKVLTVDAVTMVSG